VFYFVPMQILDLTLRTPEENLALEEALLEEAEALVAAGEETDVGACEVLRLWESPTYFVVVGAGGNVEQDVFVSDCQDAGIPILRRISGGGTVLQGPGCLNYSLVLRIASHPQCADVTATNRYVLGRLQQALRPLIGDVEIRGISDLALADKKFGGSAQRRRRYCILFHGTLLYRFDLPLVSKYLRLPAKAPSYRAGRTHENFLTNIACSPHDLKGALSREWNAGEPYRGSALQLVSQLVKSRYSTSEWNFRF
jgi:lipoate-protein ligase A